MLGYNLSRADLSRLFKGNIIIKPRGADHPRHIVFHVAGSAPHHIAYAIHHPDPDLRPFLQRKYSRFIGDEFRLGGHDGGPCSALGQFVRKPRFFMLIRHTRQHQHIHKAFDEGGFACAHRPNHANINIAICPLGNIPIQLNSLHIPLPPRFLHVSIRYICARADNMHPWGVWSERWDMQVKKAQADGIQLGLGKACLNGGRYPCWSVPESANGWGLRPS